jgi:membrane protease subunit (stomatin/prohibitin family)
MGQAMMNAASASIQASTSPQTSTLAEDIPATLEKLHALVGKGILTQAEFDAKKAELLKKLM